MTSPCCRATASSASWSCATGRSTGPAQPGSESGSTSAFAGSYADAVALAKANPSLSANDTIPLTRQTRTKYGFYFSIDQEITDSSAPSPVSAGTTAAARF